ncbi:uncharacterized protein LOC121907034 [Thunnus maccoyii]|uniref:uncharacterized protein LOC121907034 n=1 Tax=Thunnus maccoyii TaxID=8240 RepID=UPI001C4BECC3|nr:uncharacterized protein LOC121907034 [Thunnus maccoyii]
MEDFSRYLAINWTFSLICCMFWIFSPAEGYITISQLVGSKVVLRCNVSLSTFEQLTWKMNGVNLYSFKSKTPLHVNEEAVRLNINMSLSESEQYALVMDQVQMSHAGNYTCEVTTLHAPLEHMWELIVTNVTDKAENQNELPVIALATIVPCVCCLVFIFSLILLKRVCKQHAQHSIQSPHANMHEQTEDIYVNCLETDVRQRHSNNQLFSNKPSAHLYEV